MGRTSTRLPVILAQKNRWMKGMDPKSAKQMKSDVFLSEVVATRESGAEMLDVCAVADGRFDRATSVLELKLDAYLQNFAGIQFRPAWLPKADTLREHVPHEEMHEVGRDIFHRWATKVSGAVPRTIPLADDGKPDLAASAG